MKCIAIIGPNDSLCSKELSEFGFQLGQHIASENHSIVCGGMGGFMKAVCKGVKSSPNSFQGQTIGILPGVDCGEANPFIDVAIPTGIGIARNMIIIRMADIVIAAGGGAGTLSEIAFAWQLKKKVLCVTSFEGWAKDLAGKNLDKRQEGLLVPVSSIKEIQSCL